MDLDDLRRFLAVAETSHVTAAAAQLNVPQPTVSRSVARVEAALGVAVFDRIGRSVRLNAYGELLRDHARRVLVEWDATLASIDVARDPARGQVRLGFLSSLSMWLIPTLLRDFRKVAPAVSFTLRQDANTLLAPAIRDGLLDLAITSPEPRDPALRWRALHAEQLCVTLPDDHPLAGRESIRLREVADERFVLLRSTTSIRNILDELAERAKLSLNVTFRSDEVTTVRGLVMAGIGITITPRPLGRTNPVHEEGLVDVPLSDPGAMRTVGLIWRASSQLPPVVRRFRDFAVSH